MNFPNFFPKNCPPIGSIPAKGNFYRVIIDKEGRTLKKKHFESHRESQPNRDFPPIISECDLCSVSLLEDIEEAKAFAKYLLNTIPAYRNRIGLLAYGSLSSEKGKIKHTPKPESKQLSHNDWWLPENFDGSSCFEYNGVKIEHD